MSKLLICSNDESVRESIKTALCDEYEMILCENANACPEIIKNTKIKHLIIDIDGQDEILNTIKEIKLGNSKLRITALADGKKDKKAKEAVQAGADDYLLKPIKKEQLSQLCK